MKKILENWQTTLLGAILSCLYLFQKTYHDGGMHLESIDWIDYTISSLILIGGALSGDATKTVKSAVLFFGLILFSDNSFAQPGSGGFTALPAAGVDGSIQVAGLGGVISADTNFLKSDTSFGVSIKSKINPNQSAGIQVLSDSSETNIAIFSKDSDLINSVSVGAVDGIRFKFKNDVVGNVSDTTGFAINKFYASTGFSNGANLGLTMFYGQAETGAGGLDTVYLDGNFSSGWRAIISTPSQDSAYTVTHTLYSDHTNYIAFHLKRLNGTNTYSDAPVGTKIDFLILGK